jgi:hypothetical protein
MVFTIAAHRERPGRVFLYNGYPAAILEFWPRLDSNRVIELLGPEAPKGNGKYLTHDELLTFLDGLDQFLSEARST